MGNTFIALTLMRGNASTAFLAPGRTSQTKTTANRTFGRTQPVRSDVYSDIEMLTGKNNKYLGINCN